MKIPAGLPAEIAREAVVVIAGAALAALAVKMFPQFKQWIKDAWA